MIIKKSNIRKSNIRKSNIRKSNIRKLKSKKLNFHGGAAPSLRVAAPPWVSFGYGPGTVSNEVYTRPEMGYETRRRRRLKRDAKKSWGKVKKFVNDRRDARRYAQLMGVDLSEQPDSIKNISDLLDLGANVNFQEEKNLNTPLMYATYYNNIDIVRLLIAREEINLDIQNKFGETALYLAARSGNYEILNLLLEADANSTINNNENVSPLNISYSGYHAKYGNEDCEKCFKAIFRKNVYNLLGDDNITAFDVLMQDDVDIVDFILEGFDWKGEGGSTGNFVYRLDDGGFNTFSLEYLKKENRLTDLEALTPNFTGQLNPYTGQPGTLPQPAPYDFDDYNVFYECNNTTGNIGPGNVNTTEQYMKVGNNLFILDPYWVGTLDGPDMFNGVEAHDFQIPMYLGSDTIGIYILQPYKLIRSVVEKRIFRFRELWLYQGLPVPDVVTSGDKCGDKGDIQTYELTREGDGAFILNGKPIMFKKGAIH